MRSYKIQVGTDMVIPSAQSEWDARLEARELAAANPEVEVLLWWHTPWAAGRECIQKPGTALRWDGKNDECDENLNRWYAVQVGEDYGCCCGSEDYATALEIARKRAKEYPGAEVRIAHCTLQNDFAGIVEEFEIIEAQ